MPCGRLLAAGRHRCHSSCLQSPAPAYGPIFGQANFTKAETPHSCKCGLTQCGAQCGMTDRCGGVLFFLQWPTQGLLDINDADRHKPFSIRILDSNILKVLPR